MLKTVMNNVTLLICALVTVGLPIWIKSRKAKPAKNQEMTSDHQRRGWWRKFINSSYGLPLVVVVSAFAGIVLMWTSSGPATMRKVVFVCLDSCFIAIAYTQYLARISGNVTDKIIESMGKHREITKELATEVGKKADSRRKRSQVTEN